MTAQIPASARRKRVRMSSHRLSSSVHKPSPSSPVEPFRRMTRVPASFRRSCSSSAIRSNSSRASGLDRFALARACAMVAVHSASCASSRSMSAFRLENEEGGGEKSSLTRIVPSSPEALEGRAGSQHRRFDDLDQEVSNHVPIDAKIEKLVLMFIGMQLARSMPAGMAEIPA